MNFPCSNDFSLHNNNNNYLWCFFCSSAVMSLSTCRERQSSKIPAVTVLHTLVDCFLADPGLVSTRATVQSGLHVHTALIWSLALAHGQHLCHIVRHAAIELPSRLLTAAAVALHRACLKNRCEVPVANCITDANSHLVRAGSGTIVHCMGKCSEWVLRLQKHHVITIF